MLKKLVIIVGMVVLLAAIGSTLFLYNTYNGTLDTLKALESENESLMEDNGQLKDKEQDLQESILSLGEKAEKSETIIGQLTDAMEVQKAEMDKSQEELEEAKALLAEIGVRLKTTGDPLVKIQQVMNENESLRAYLNDQSEASVPEPVDDSSLFKQLETDLNNVSDSVESRIGELETIIKPLSELSLERIMVQTEIDYLIKLQEEVNAIKDNIE